MRHARFLLVILALSLALVLSTSVAGSLDGSNPQQVVSLHLTLGNPSDATHDTANENNYLLIKPQYVLSFNNSKGGPNWVSWHLQASDVGHEERGDFHIDDSLPTSFKHIKKADYTNTGFDRGHLCNSKDRTNSRDNNDATSFMTNILPQAPGNNHGPWKRLENFERSLADTGSELYIIAGAFGSGGTGKIGRKKTIAAGKVTVPTIFWKVMVILPDGNNDLARINATTRAIAVCMPNKQSIKTADWRKFVTTVRNVETATGYNFLSELNQSVQNAIETRKDSIGTSMVNPCE